MRVCYFGTYRKEYIRNRLMIDRLKMGGINVIECHETLWLDYQDRENIVAKGWKDPRYWLRFFIVYTRLLNKYRKFGKYNLMIVGYPGQLDVIIAKILTIIRKKPLIWDFYMSVYLIANERKLAQKSRIGVMVLRLLEKFSFHLSDWIIVDTDAYAEWIHNEYSVKHDKLWFLPLGADDRIFKPKSEPNSKDTFKCLYYGSYIPNHGLEYVIEAANLLRDDSSIIFELVGDGPEKHKILGLVDNYNLSNVKFLDWTSQEVLVEKISQADICLGSFGNTPQALMTMQNKIHECMAMGKVIINGDSPVMQSQLRDNANIILCAREDPLSLADKIISIKNNPLLRKSIGSEAFQYYQDHLSLDITSKSLFRWLLDINNNQQTNYFDV